MSVRAPTRYLWLINGYINIHMVFILLPLVEKGNAHSKKKKYYLHQLNKNHESATTYNECLSSKYHKSLGTKKITSM